MSDWKMLFADHILARGKNYFNEGAVQKIQTTEDGYYAIVEGTEDYEVHIDIEKGQICGMDCTCPYADDGYYCKHMAAVLYELEEQNILLEESHPEKQEEELEKIIERIPEEELRSLVKKMAEADGEIRDMLLLKYAVKIDKNQIDRLKEEVDHIVWKYGDISGFIGYRDTWNFAYEMEEFLEDKSNILFNKGCYFQAFELVSYIFETIGSLDIDDFDGGVYQVVNVCGDKWKEILQNCDEEEKNKIFSWFMNHMSCNYVMDYMEDFMEEFLFNEFQSREMMEKKLKNLDERIEKQENSIGNESTWSARYDYENNIIKRLELMKRLNYSEKEIKKYRKKYWQFPEVRKQEMQECLERGDTDQAIQILKESKLLDSKYPGLVAQYYEQLISIYEKQSDKKEYKTELVDYIFRCAQNNLTYIQKLKTLCAEKEWEQYRDQILRSRNNYYIMYLLMESEGMYEQMLACLRKENTIYNLDRYEKVLKKKFSDQVRDIYVAYIQKASERSGGRDHYRGLINYLKKIQKYPGGKEKAAEIAKNWRNVYRRRTAMMDEMRKAGF